LDETAIESPSLCILIADDSDSDRMILETLVRRQGHQVVVAADGSEAVEKYRKHRPQLVLMDVMMPYMDGIEAAQQIKAIAGETLVPVIFLTSLSDADALARCLEAGGDDFLSKPYNRVIIAAKIQAFNRMREMHQALSVQRDLIRERNRQLLEEQTIARRVFDNIAHTGCLGAPNIRYHASPLSVFNGDVLFACPQPLGGMNVLIGDFTGHGLPAAIGAMPIAEIFYGMTSKGFRSGDILREINQKLTRILPTDMFCCAALIEADFHTGTLTVWNGGLPEGYLLRRNGQSQSLPSQHLPLGISTPERFSVRAEVLSAEPGDRLFFATDGVVEASNLAGEMFGPQRLSRALAGAQSPVSTVLDHVRAFTGDLNGGDDLTLLSLEMMPDGQIDRLPTRIVPSALNGPSHWTCHYEVKGDTLAHFNPLPLLLHICMEVPGLRRHSGEVYALLSELYTNALEHGVLQLSSELKDSAAGFGRYYAERERGLREASSHAIRFTLEHEMYDGGGDLRVICEDTGPGFDYTEYATMLADKKGYSGRGLALVDQLCSLLVHHGKGNRVEAIYHWSLQMAVGAIDTAELPGKGESK
jgi:CheY-like chemotaxis protein